MEQIESIEITVREKIAGKEASVFKIEPPYFLMVVQQSDEALMASSKCWGTMPSSIAESLAMLHGLGASMDATTKRFQSIMRDALRSTRPEITDELAFRFIKSAAHSCQSTEALIRAAAALMGIDYGGMVEWSDARKESPGQPGKS